VDLQDQRWMVRQDKAALETILALRLYSCLHLCRELRLSMARKRLCQSSLMRTPENDDWPETFTPDPPTRSFKWPSIPDFLECQDNIEPEEDDSLSRLVAVL
jgi:hypothetical protein